MSVDNILPLLSKLKKKGAGKWLACCPCHNDKSPSLAITDLSGVILIHCFGCGASGVDVCEALNVDISELFPAREKYNDENSESIGRKYFDPNLILDAISRELMLALVVLNSMAKDDKIAAKVKERLCLSISRIESAIDYTAARNEHIERYNEFMKKYRESERLNG